MADDIKERLERRQEARLAELDRRKQEKADQTQPEEHPTALLFVFNKSKEIVEKMLEDLDKLGRENIAEHLDEAARKTQDLQKFLSNSLAFLPFYDVKKRQQELKKLEQDIIEKRSCHLPKKKFAFNRKKQARIEKPVVSAQHDEILSTEASTESKTPMETTTGLEMFTRGQQIIKEQPELQDKDMTFSKLQESSITLYGSPSALHLENLEHCKVFCGPVSGSVFINDCKNCTFVFPCQQLRVHTTVDSHFYLLVTSRAIIEDCQCLGFAEFNWSYQQIGEHFETSRLDKTKNNWNLVKDFNWLRADEHSPNWYLVKDEEKVKSWN